MSIDDYISSQPEEKQPVLLSARQTIAAMKNHLGIYPGDGGVKAFKDEIEERGLKYSKGAIQFP